MIFLISKLLLATLCCVPLGATGQVVDAPESSLGAEQKLGEAQRVAIDAKRQQLQSGFAAEDATCHTRFAVNNCLRDVDARRTASLADLRRQDIFLNDQERKRRGAEEIRRIESKQTGVSQQELAEKRAKMVSEYEARMLAFDQRQREKKPSADAERAAIQANANRLKTAETKIEARRRKQVNAPHEAAKSRTRQVEAEKRHAEHAQQQASRQPGRAKTLPVPP